MSRVLIAGCGDVGSALARGLAADGDEVLGLRRDPSGLGDPIRPVAADLRDPGSLTATVADLPPLDAVVVAVTADERTSSAYRETYLDGTNNLGAALQQAGNHPARWVFTSSTAVYGVRDGSWVGADTEPAPRSATGEVILAAEQALRSLADEPVVVRPAGIYGPGRTRLIDRVRRGEATYPAVPQYTNRIHRDDCAAALDHVLSLDSPAPVYTAADHEPAEKGMVLRWLADRLDAPEPREIPGEGRRGRNKRVGNERLAASGLRLRYPTFREGYAAVLAGREG